MTTVVKTKLRLVHSSYTNRQHLGVGFRVPSRPKQRKDVDLSAESVDYRRGGFVSPTDPQGFVWQDSVKRLLSL